ncbi:MAG: prolyl oligopeptidase family serine peptidase [Gammaproteobacteria bacterium]|nr:prolyl oligopeptidase family serine peptidase [Gammaproteobacteria bacterium]MDH5310751.1 prolyl oligopeptidase family serine peptidase [Gammaproteobacteria bacterium]
MAVSDVDPADVSITRPVAGSDIPVHLVYIETVDGLYTPIGIRKPQGNGPFPMVLFASGNGGGGMPWVMDATNNTSWTQEQFVAAGYAVAWMRYRAEVELAYDKYGKLVEDIRQGRQLLNRGPLEYEDVISIIEYVKELPYVDPERVGYMGMSHGGEMAFKITSEYHGLRAAIASEPANHEFLSLTPDDTAHVNPDTGLRDIESMLMRETEKVRGRIRLDVANARIATISTPIFVQGRNTDELQGIFRVGYDLLQEAGKESEWKTYEHDVHGFVYVKRNAAGIYDPDEVQVEAVADSIAFFDKYMKH